MIRSFIVVCFSHGIAREQEETTEFCLYLMASEEHNDTQDMYDPIDRAGHSDGE
jgi:hypothetical protein